MNFPTFNTMEEMMAYYYGTPGTLLRKREELADQTVGAGTHWEPLYGKKAWSWLNLEANPFAIIPKEPWQKTGWRVLTTAAYTSGGGVDEGTSGGAVPASTNLTFDQISANPKIMAHTVEVSEAMDFVSGVDDAIALLPFYREEIAKEHAFCIAASLATDADTLASYNFESIDRVVSSNAEGALFTATTDADIYGDTARSTGTTWDSNVSHNSDTDRDLTLTIIDDMFEDVLEDGGKPKVFLTKHNTKTRWQQLLEAERRYMDAARVIPTFGGVASAMGGGVEAGFQVATYNGIPILESQHVFASDTLGSLYALDTDYLKIAVAKPTTYVESGFDSGMVDRGYFTAKGVYRTLGELRAYAFNKHGKLRDLQ